MTNNVKVGEYMNVGGSATHVLFNFPGYGALHIGSIETISYSTYRDKTPVYNLGNININGFALGKRYIAGSLIKTLFIYDDLKQFLTRVKDDIGLEQELNSIYQMTNDSFKTYHHLLIDDVMPFDIIILMASEYGAYHVTEVIYGCTFINTGQVHSINDMITQSTMSFIANDVRQTHTGLESQTSSFIVPSTAEAASSIGEVNRLSDGAAYANYYIEAGYTRKQIIDMVNAGTLPKDTLAYLDIAEYNNKVKTIGVPLTNSDGTKIVVPDMKDTVTKDTTSSSIGATTDSTSIVATKTEFASSEFVTTNKNDVVDGDTISFDNINNLYGESVGSVSIRLIGIDAPETSHDSSGLSQPYGKEAKAFLEEYVSSGKWDKDVASGAVKTDFGTDKYGRTLVYNSNYAAALVGSGLAYVDATSLKTAGTKEVNKVMEAYTSARNSGLGVWNTDNPVLVTPKTWRSMTTEERQEYLDRIGS